jgi:cytochrome c oxidase cbb3-type subunit 3
MKKILLSAIVVTLTLTSHAAGSTATAGIAFTAIMLWIIAILAVVLLITVFTLQRAVSSLKKELHSERHEATLSTWEKLLSLKPLSAEKEIELDHNFDGIKELNNPIPPWFNVLFYGTVIFAFFYLIIYHVIDAAPLQTKEYQNEIAAAKLQKDEYIKKSGNLIDENNVTRITDKTKLGDAGKIFAEKCAVCHGANAEGKVGPTLTDAYWLHGGTIKDIFKTIKYGVPAKGMVTWENVLKPNEIQQVASYILSLQGSNPPGAKEPQGEQTAESSPDPSGATPKDTTGIQH